MYYTIYSYNKVHHHGLLYGYSWSKVRRPSRPRKHKYYAVLMMIMMMWWSVLGQQTPPVATFEPPVTSFSSPASSGPSYQAGLCWATDDDDVSVWVCGVVAWWLGPSHALYNTSIIDELYYHLWNLLCILRVAVGDVTQYLFRVIFWLTPGQMRRGERRDSQLVLLVSSPPHYHPNKDLMLSRDSQWGTFLE